MVLPPGHRGDFAPVTVRFRTACFIVEGINSFATVLYFSYLYFFFRDRYGFHDRQNLELAALIGLIYVFAAWQGGRFAQRHGNFKALKIGFAVMAAGFAAGLFVHAMVGQIALACVVNIGMCMIWPVLEALVSESPNPARAVGLYNITWAVANASAFFIGGTIIDKLGYQSLFYVPFVLMLLQFTLAFRLEKIHGQETVAANGKPPPPERNRPTPELAKKFQGMAWMANPFAYIAINTLIAVLPGIAKKFNLSPMEAGFMCSLWGFARVFAFVVLMKWSGWHYRFRWLVLAFALLIISFAVILIAPSRAAILAAQIFFGLGIGLIYYSSLYYSMDASKNKSEHGVGNCLGPAAGATALWLVPQDATIGAWAVSGVLTLGLGGLVWLRQRPAKP